MVIVLQERRVRVLALMYVQNPCKTARIITDHSMPSTFFFLIQKFSVRP